MMRWAAAAALVAAALILCFSPADPVKESS